MSAIPKNHPFLYWTAAACFIVALGLSWTYDSISVPFSHSVLAFLIFGLAVLGVILMYLYRREDSYAERRRVVIYGMFLLDMIMLPLKEIVPYALRLVSMLCLLAALGGMVYTYYHRKNLVGEE